MLKNLLRDRFTPLQRSLKNLTILKTVLNLFISPVRTGKDQLHRRQPTFFRKLAIRLDFIHLLTSLVSWKELK